jgi:ComF family protein
MIKVYNWLNIIQDYLLPPTCLLCGNTGCDGRDLCAACYRQLPRNTHHCPQCAVPFAALDAATLCGRCLRLPPAFDAAYAPFIHQGAVRHLVTSLKFRADYKNARLLGQLLAGHLQQNTPKPQLIVPVPLYKARYRQRGFNQSIEIARTVAKALQIPLDLNSCQRHRDTPQQMMLTAKQRRNNMKNAFTVAKPIDAQHVAILDDVMTTGTTANELAAVLKTAGVRRVDVWACARA